ncbi:MAG: primosomal protein N' [Desulfobulbaceae bacterium]
MMKTCEVAVAAPVSSSLTYGVPEEWAGEIEPGSMVLVPLGRRRVTGYVLELGDGDVMDGSIRLRPILELLHPDPVFPASLIPFYRWIADYYHHPLGEVIRSALPGGLTTGSRRVVRLTPAGMEMLFSSSTDELPDEEWILTLLDKEKLSPTMTRTLLNDPAARRLLRGWEKKGLVTIDDELQRGDFLARKQVVVVPDGPLAKVLRPGITDASDFVDTLSGRFPGLLKSEYRTLELFAGLWCEKGGMEVPRPELTSRYAGAGKALHRLADQGLIRLEERRVYRDLFGERPSFLPRPETLTDDQETVLAEILPAIRKQVFQAFLLHGVTGCGKTEVYLRAAEQALAEGLSVLVLVPEIALSSQIEAHFYSRFGDVLAVLHSGLSPGERHDQWELIRRGRARVVVGARSAVFAPLERPGIIIVDEEHEPAYKQDDGLRYNGRDLAVLRAKFAGCPVILGSATPSVVAYRRAQEGKFRLLRMPDRVHGRELPKVEIVDLGREKKSRPDLLFSDTLISALWENMERGGQSLLFLNRRGFAGFMMCRDCGHIVQCRHCRVSLTLHRSRRRLVCHYCGYSLPPNLVCPDCGSAKVEGMGLGSERVEEEARQVIPHARVARLDSDTAVNRKHYLQTLRQVRRGEVDILVGTQMIAKGLHFPGITLVGIVWADSGLAMPDFRASERTFQLLAQVTGRAGRGGEPGRVVIQTYQPHHYSVLCARDHDYTGFYEQETALREELGYPPFSRLVNIRFSAPDEGKVRKQAERVAAFLRRAAEGHSVNTVEILGPAPSPLARIRDRSRWQLLLKGESRLLHHLCTLLLQEEKNERGGVRMAIDVDPESMM